MRFAKISAVAATAALSFAATGCATRLATLPIVSTKNVDMSVPHELVQRNVEGDETRIWLLFFPLGTEPSLQRAIDEAIEEVGADYLRSASVESSWWSFILFSGGHLNVKGDAWRQTPVEVESTTTTTIKTVPKGGAAPAPSEAPAP